MPVLPHGNGNELPDGDAQHRLVLPRAKFQVPVDQQNGEVPEGDSGKRPLIKMHMVSNASVMDVIRRTHSDGDLEKQPMLDDEDNELKDQVKPLEKLKKMFTFVALAYTVLGNMGFAFESVAHKNLQGACQASEWFGYIQWIGVPFFSLLSVFSSLLSFLSFLLLLGVVGKTVVESFRLHRWNRVSHWSADLLTKHQMEQRHDAPFVFLASGTGSLLASTWVIAFFEHDGSLHQGAHLICGIVHDKLTWVAAFLTKIGGWVAAITCFLSSLFFVFIFAFYLMEYYGFYRKEKRKAFPI